MARIVTSVTLTLPPWLAAMAVPEALASVPERMALVNELARRNIDEGTGGPFAAGVFEQGSGRVVGLGVNRVVPLSASSAHAEVMALTMAQAAVGQWDLGAGSLPAHQLVVNWRPCAMCFGAVLWSGVVELVLAGAGSELEALTGFDEGPIHPAWEAELAARGVALSVGVGRDDAIATFEAFRASGAEVYNGRGGGRR